MNIQEFLNERHVEYGAARHRPTYTARELARCFDVPRENVVKTVVLNADGEHVLALLEAADMIDLPTARAALGAESVKLAVEDELADLFPDCELGAIPPFGSQYGIKTIVDEPLTHDEYIMFDGNSHREAFSMSYRDFEEIEHPHVVTVSRHY